jgi:hypothetical protein
MTTVPMGVMTVSSKLLLGQTSQPASQPASQLTHTHPSLVSPDKETQHGPTASPARICILIVCRLH